MSSRYEELVNQEIQDIELEIYNLNWLSSRLAVIAVAFAFLGALAFEAQKFAVGGVMLAVGIAFVGGVVGCYLSKSPLMSDLRDRRADLRKCVR